MKQKYFASAVTKPIYLNRMGWTQNCDICGLKFKRESSKLAHYLFRHGFLAPGCSIAGKVMEYDQVQTLKHQIKIMVGMKEDKIYNLRFAGLAKKRTRYTWSLIQLKRLKQNISEYPLYEDDMG